MIPLMAMLFRVEGWAWSVADFVVSWILIAGFVLAYRLVSARATSWAYRFATGIGLTTGLLLIWINGAVGLIGSEDNPANVLYAGVLGVGVIGAVIGRLEPRGLEKTLYAMAIAQLAVPVLAVAFWPEDFSPGIVPVFALNLFFALVFAGAGWLFRLAGRDGEGRRKDGEAVV